jgi:hypothetical protein
MGRPCSGVGAAAFKGRYVEQVWIGAIGQLES